MVKNFKFIGTICETYYNGSLYFFPKQRERLEGVWGESVTVPPPLSFRAHVSSEQSIRKYMGVKPPSDYI